MQGGLGYWPALSFLLEELPCGQSGLLEGVWERVPFPPWAHRGLGPWGSVARRDPPPSSSKQAEGDSLSCHCEPCDGISQHSFGFLKSNLKATVLYVWLFSKHLKSRGLSMVLQIRKLSSVPHVAIYQLCKPSDWYHLSLLPFCKLGSYIRFL